MSRTLCSDLGRVIALGPHVPSHHHLINYRQYKQNIHQQLKLYIYIFRKRERKRYHHIIWYTHFNCSIKSVNLGFGIRSYLDHPDQESGLKFESQPAAHEAGEGSRLLGVFGLPMCLNFTWLHRAGPHDAC